MYFLFLCSSRFCSIIFLILLREKGRWQKMPGGSAGKESACNAGDLGLIPGLGRSPGEGKGYRLQYSGLENSMDCIVHGVAKSRTQLRNFHFTFQYSKDRVSTTEVVTIYYSSLYPQGLSQSFTHSPYQKMFKEWMSMWWIFLSLLIIEGNVLKVIKSETTPFVGLQKIGAISL